MYEVELADSVVHELSGYLLSGDPGAGHFAAERLLSVVEGRISVGLPDTVYLTFRADPGDDAAIAALKVYVAREAKRDGAFARALKETLGDQAPRRPALLLRRIQAPVAVLGVIGLVGLGAGFGIGSVSSTATPAFHDTTTITAPPATLTTTPTTTTVSSTTTSTSGAGGTSTSTAPTSGDGSTLPKGSPVYLADLPVPSGRSVFDHGDHDVQLKQYQDALWYPLNACSDSYTSGEQEFRLTNFTQLVVKGAGTDGTSDSSLTVKFEVFANDDAVHALGSVVANPGQTVPLEVNLPAGVFAVTLRVSLVTLDKKKCPRGYAVWGSPYVVAAGQ